jgi:drug/metabolite transporter superfamily protein YnfA
MADVQRCMPLALSLRSVRRALMLLLTALVLVQTVGVLHRVVHAQQSAGVFSHAAPAGVADDASLLAAIWGGHSNSAECQLFDQTCPDLLHVPVWALPAVVIVPIWRAASLREHFALFERFYAARGPPAVLH